ncbi:MAG: hypothetical protein AABZ66_04225, partial [Candidatus Binatota bacterium]
LTLRGEAEGSANEAADVEIKRFGLSTAPSAAAEGALPEGSYAASRGRVAPEERLSNGRGRNALFPETFFGRSRKRVPRGNVA